VNPISLKAENFLSYGKIDLDLSGVSLAAIVGQNGAGKSSLLDMLTWSLYGTGRYDLADDYIRQGCEQAMAENVFELNGEVYRVIRTRSNKGKGKTTLEFAKRVGNDWVPLSGTTIPETHQKIISVLRLDYTTFISTCFILQKQSDKFSSATPGERKAVLAKALGLDFYDKLLDVAKARLKGYKEKCLHYETEIGLLEKTIEDKAVYEVTVTTIKDHIAENERKQAQIQEVIDKLEAQRAAIQRKIDELDVHKRRRSELEKASTAIDMFLTELREKEQFIRDNAGLDSMLSGKEKARQQEQTYLEHYTQKLTEHKVTAGKAPDLEVAITKAENQQKELATQYGEIKKKQERYAKILDNADLVRERARLNERLKEKLAGLDQKQKQYQALKDKARELESKASEFDKEQESNIKRLEGLISQYAEQVALLDKVPCDEAMQGTCPLLQNAVAAKEEIKRITMEKNGWQSKANPYVDEWQQAVKERDAVGYSEEKHVIVKEQLQETEAYSKLLPELESAEESIKDLKEQEEKNTAAAIETGAEIGRLRKELEGAKLAQEKVAGYEKMLAETKAVIQSLDADIKSLQEKQAKVMAQKDQVESMKEDLPAKMEEQQKIAAELKEIDEKLGQAETLEKELECTCSDIRVQKGLLEEHRNTLGAYQAELGKALAKLEDITKAEEQRTEIEAKIKAAAHEIYLYETLTKAFGKNGIPALIIENALPDIETIANDLLGTLTDGRMRLELVTQKETKTAGVSETLDIIISDELGPRPYEGWSGAESYEVDVALRVAISRFLAKRAGASMKTLVIDEGLGSLDAEGKQKFIGAVNALASDFDKVLCISHIDEIKEAFPQQIVVRKTPSGSIAEVV
jgi:exonuclease SbcC